jgi:hypothetical protein
MNILDNLTLDNISNPKHIVLRQKYNTYFCKNCNSWRLLKDFIGTKGQLVIRCEKGICT